MASVWLCVCGRFGDDGALVILERLAGGVELGRLEAGHFQRRHFLVGVEVLDDALAGQEDRVNDGDRQQDVAA